MISTNSDLIGAWVAKKIGFDWFEGRATAIGRIKNGEIVAGVVYEDYNGANVMCHIAGSGNWASREFLSIIFDYPFNQLQCKRITAVVVQSNEKSRRLVEHLGFEVEANLRDAHPDGDLIVYRMTADKCRWTKELPYENFSRSARLAATGLH